MKMKWLLPPDWATIVSSEYNYAVPSTIDFVSDSLFEIEHHIMEEIATDCGMYTFRESR